MKKLEVYVATAVIYWVITFLLSKGFQFTGRKLGFTAATGKAGGV